MLIFGDEENKRAVKSQPNHGIKHVRLFKELHIGDYYDIVDIQSITRGKLIEGPIGSGEDERLVFEVWKGSRISRYVVDLGLKPYANGYWNRTNHLKRVK